MLFFAYRIVSPVIVKVLNVVRDLCICKRERRRKRSSLCWLHSSATAERWFNLQLFHEHFSTICLLLNYKAVSIISLWHQQHHKQVSFPSYLTLFARDLIFILTLTARLTSTSVLRHPEINICSSALKECMSPTHAQCSHIPFSSITCVYRYPYSLINHKKRCKIYTEVQKQKLEEVKPNADSRSCVERLMNRTVPPPPAKR